MERTRITGLEVDTPFGILVNKSNKPKKYKYFVSQGSINDDSLSKEKNTVIHRGREATEVIFL